MAVKIREYQLLIPSREELIKRLTEAIQGGDLALSARLIPDELAAQRGDELPPRDFMLKLENIKPTTDGLDVVTRDNKTGDTVFIFIGHETVSLKVVGE